LMSRNLVGKTSAAGPTSAAVRISGTTFADRRAVRRAGAIAANAAADIAQQHDDIDVALSGTIASAGQPSVQDEPGEVCPRRTAQLFLQTVEGGGHDGRCLGHRLSP